MFDILKRDQHIHQHHLIEASAGTGKTFTIENLVVRLLTEFTLDQIAVMTFTRAATRDLQGRIRSALIRVKTTISLYIKEGTIDKSCPDYVVEHLERGNNQALIFAKKIDQALFLIDQANIDTIHGFCAKMLARYPLESHQTIVNASPQEPQRFRDLTFKAIGEFLRTELSSTRYTKGQLKKVLGKSFGNITHLQKKLLNSVEKGIEIRSSFSLKETLEKFSQTMKHLKQEHGLESSKIMNDFFAKAPQFTGICKLNKEVKPEIHDAINNFVNLFNKDVWDAQDLDLLISDGLVFLEIFDESKRAKKQVALKMPLHYPEINTLLSKELKPIILHARSTSVIFGSIAQECQLYIKKILQDNDISSHQELLSQMANAVKLPAFAKQLRHTFKAVIVDEFQDTDPTQWEIFSTVFLNSTWDGRIYLVGDPKQSIYGFRQADIYTYLTAESQLKNGSKVTLDTNFRSHAHLVEALNILFQSIHEPFPLPLNSKNIPYRPVLAGKNLEHPCSDRKGSVEFWLTEEDLKWKSNYQQYESELLIPKLIDEIGNLKSQGIQHNQCAILVKDAVQSKHIEKALMASGICVKKQRGVHLGKTEALIELRTLLNGIIHYKNRKNLLLCLTTRPIGWSQQEILALNQETAVENDNVMNLCAHLKTVLTQDGFGCFYRELMTSCWKENQTSVLSNLLQQQEGIEFYRNWQDLSDLITLRQQKDQLTPEGLLEWLDDFQNTLDQDQEEFQGYLDPDSEGVSLLTIHVSKGLEFDFVFALGLVKSQAINEELIPKCVTEDLTDKRTHFLIPIEDQNHSDYLHHIKELDAEKLRQLYVALTRAKFRVYIPVLFKEINETTALTPIDLLLDRLPLKERNIKGFQIFLEPHNAFMSSTTLSSQETILKPVQKSPPILVPPQYLHIKIDPVHIQSFTSISRHLNEAKKPEINEVDPKPLNAPQQFDAEEMNAHTLPAGNETGILLHTIYENICFEKVRDMKNNHELIPFIQSYTANTPYERWNATLATLVFDSLTIPLTEEIHSETCYREMPFMYACEKRLIRNGLKTEGGFIKGVIDLVYMVKGKYYILDWKSNWLGPTDADYSQEHLKQAILENGYDVQAALYVEALKKYLNILNGCKFDSIFGGVYYFFVRSPAGFIKI